MIVTPPETYFIYGLSHWSKEFILGIIHPEISISLQKDGYTQPLRPLGFILKVNSILAAFDRDVSSKLIDGKKEFSPWSPKSRNYSDLSELINNTRRKSHNELWASSSEVEIIGGYIVGKSKSFEKRMITAGYSIHYLNDLNISSHLPLSNVTESYQVETSHRGSFSGPRTAKVCLPIAPAKCRIEVSTVTTKSTAFINEAVSPKSLIGIP